MSLICPASRPEIGAAEADSVNADYKGCITGTRCTRTCLILEVLAPLRYLPRMMMVAIDWIPHDAFWSNQVYTLIPLARSKAISLLPCPEHHIRIPRKTQRRDAMFARNPFPFFKLDVVICDYMGE